MVSVIQANAKYKCQMCDESACVRIKVHQISVFMLCRAHARRLMLALKREMHDVEYPVGSAAHRRGQKEKKEAVNDGRI